MTERQPVTILLPERLAAALRDAAWSAGRLTPQGAVILDHLVLVDPESALGTPSKPLLRAFKRLARLFRGRADDESRGGCCTRPSRPQA